MKANEFKKALGDKFKVSFIPKNHPLTLAIVEMLRGTKIDMRGRSVAGAWSAYIAPQRTRLDRIAVTAHEVAHCYQQQRDPLWFVNYVFNRQFRAREESLAMRVEMEVRYHMTGRKPTVESIMGDSEHVYRLRKIDVKVMEKNLTITRNAMVRGKGSHPVSKYAIKLLKEG
jgi:hypothetical protein